MSSALETERKMRTRGKWLSRAGWAMFGLSLALPAVKVFGWFSGWGCLWIVYQMAWEVVRSGTEALKDGAGLYYAGLAITNSLLLVNPLLHRMWRGDLRRLRRLGLVLAAATLYTWWYLVLVIMEGLPSLRGYNVGFYCWLLSFPLVTAGTLHMAVKRPDRRPNPSQSLETRSQEELAAELELEEYLGHLRPIGYPAANASSTGS